MKRIFFSLCILLAVVSAGAAQEISSVVLRAHLSERVEQDMLPGGLFAAVVGREGVAAVAAAGVRQWGWSTEVTVRDLVRINSNTKAMTATMLAHLVEDGTFPNGWQTTIGTVFPELLDTIHQDHHSVTLFELLSMQSGIERGSTKPPDYVYLSIPSIADRRYAIIKDRLQEPSAGARGEFLYSNLGYMVAGAMAERLTQKSWEALMQERLFKPLAMTTAGFGEPSERAQNQPWGHYFDRGGYWVSAQKPVPESMGPAGSVSLSIEDWAKFITLWFRDTAPAILDRPTMTGLVTPEPSDYRYVSGWNVRRKRGTTTRIRHGGSHTAWRSQLYVYPTRGKAYLAVAAFNDRYKNSKTKSMLRSIIRFMR